MAGMLPVGQSGTLGTGDCGIGGPGNRENGGRRKPAEKTRRTGGGADAPPRTAGHGGCGRGYLRGRMATMRVPPVYPESMYISPCRWVTIRRQR